jgi:hypothetical protein
MKTSFLTATLTAAAPPSVEIARNEAALSTPMFNPPENPAPQDTAIFSVWADINYKGRHEDLLNTTGYCCMYLART